MSNVTRAEKVLQGSATVRQTMTENNITNKNRKHPIRHGVADPRATNRPAQFWEIEASKKLNTEHRILFKFDPHYSTLYDDTIRTFALLKIKKIHDAWKILKKHRKRAPSEPPILNHLEMAASSN